MPGRRVRAMKGRGCLLAVVLVLLFTRCSEKSPGLTEPERETAPSAGSASALFDTTMAPHGATARYWGETSHTPTLSFGRVWPFRGSPNEDYGYRVEYHDPDGDPPSLIQVCIDGSPNDMALAEGRPDSGTYSYTTRMTLGDTHKYFFRCRDQHGGPARLPAQGSRSGPEVHGTNADVRVAVHVLPHASRSCTKNFPVIETGDDIITTEPGADADCFPVFYYIEEYKGFDYALTWPGMYSTVFTSCSDVTVGEIVWPGDGISQTWNTCHNGFTAITGWAWIYDYGVVQVIPHPDLGSINVRDCHDTVGVAHPNYSVFAGIGGTEGASPVW